MSAEPIYFQTPSQGPFLRLAARPPARILAQRTPAGRTRRKTGNNFSAPGMSADAASFSELISHVNAILKAFGENALPEDTDAENLLDRLRLVAGRLASGKARQNQDLAGMGLSQSVARRVLARKAQARRTSGRATQDMDRLLRGIERLGGRPQHIPAATWALIIRETERAQQRGR